VARDTDNSQQPRRHGNQRDKSEAPEDAVRLPADLAELSPSAVAVLQPFALWRRQEPTDQQVSLTRSVLAHLLRGLAAMPPPHAAESTSETTTRWLELAAALDSGDLSAARIAAHWLSEESRLHDLGDCSGVEVQLSSLYLASQSEDGETKLLALMDMVLALLPLTGPDAPRDSEAMAEFTLAAERGLERVLDRMRQAFWDGLHLPWHAIAADHMLAALQADVEAQGYWQGHGSRLRERIDNGLLRAAERGRARREASAARRRAAREAERRAADRSRIPGLLQERDADDAQQNAPEGPDAAAAPDRRTPFPGFDPRRLTENRNALGSRYEPLGQPMPVTLVPPLAEVMERLSSLAAEMPNARPVLDLVQREMALLGLGPARPLTLPPLLLVGPPGIGKTRLARRIAAVLGLGFAWQSAAASSDTRELSGTARGWSSTHPAWPVEQLVVLRTANPLLLIDEVDKASRDRRNGSMFDALLTYLERDTARSFEDPCVGGAVDLSLISWVLTANDRDGLPAPLRSRLHVAVMEPPEPEALPSLIATMRQDLAVELGLPDPRLLPELSAEQVALLQQDFGRHRDPRRIKRALRSLLALVALGTGEAAH
jgi:hypothetical protein